MLDFFLSQLQNNTNFEFIQAIFNLFLRVHGDVLVRHENLLTKLIQLKSLQKQRWRYLEQYFHSSLCLTSFFSNTQ